MAGVCPALGQGLMYFTLSFLNHMLTRSFLNCRSLLAHVYAGTSQRLPGSFCTNSFPKEDVYMTCSFISASGPLPVKEG